MSQTPGNGGLNTFTGKWQRKTQAAENGDKAPIGLYMSQASMSEAMGNGGVYMSQPSNGLQVRLLL
jgi:hypothetical protein